MRGGGGGGIFIYSCIYWCSARISFEPVVIRVDFKRN